MNFSKLEKKFHTRLPPVFLNQSVKKRFKKQFLENKITEGTITEG